MAKKDTILYTSIYPSRRQRIKIPQSDYKPLIIEEHGREVDRPQDAWWWIFHRRGIYNPDIGVDPLEGRAVPKSVVNGTLPERIVYRWLCNAYFKPDVDFDFQSSLLGGRLELGGIVADFLFPYEMLIIQVQGPTHEEHLRRAKDEEQRAILENMGYSLAYLDEPNIYSVIRFEDTMKRIFNFGGAGTGPASGGSKTENAEAYSDIEQRVDSLASEWEVTFDRCIN